MATKLHAAEVVGLSGKIIDVEIDLSPGLFHFSIVGLADKAVSEAKERVSAAIKSIGARSPQNDKPISFQQGLGGPYMGKRGS